MTLLNKVQKILSPVLTPVSKGYGLIMSERARRYAEGRCERFAPSCPCVSVGNIGSGGSGKTPVTDWILKWAELQSITAVVLTRGYGASPKSLPYLVGPHSPVSEAGDEPLMLAMKNPGAKVVVDPIRKRSGAWAEGKFSPDLVVLDDGFQHMAVRRDLDLVLLTPDDFDEGWDKVIPRGTWRESEAALKRADVFLVKCSPEDFNSMRGMVQKRLEKYDRPVFQFDLEMAGLKKIGSGETEHFGNNGYLLFAGIGKPDLLEKNALKFIGRAPVEFVVFKDHHAYTVQDIKRIRARAAASGVDKIICTPKDAVKLRGLECDDFYEIDLEVVFKETVFSDGAEGCTFEEWWSRERLEDAYRKR